MLVKFLLLFLIVGFVHSQTEFIDKMKEYGQMMQTAMSMIDNLPTISPDYGGSEESGDEDYYDFFSEKKHPKFVGRNE